MTILADAVVANIIVEPTTGDIDVIVDQPEIIVDAPGLAPVLVEIAGAPGKPGNPGPPGPTAVSADAGNTATLGSDSLIYVSVPPVPEDVAVIIDGAGVPAEELGNEGDYYLDSAGQVLYGPKNSTGPPTETTQGNLAPTNQSSGTLTVGVRLRFNTARRITAIRFYRHAGATETTRVLTVYKASNGAVLTSVSTSLESGTGWQSWPLPIPLDMAVNDDIVVAYNTSSQFNYEVLPVSLVAAATLVEGRYVSGSFGFPSMAAPYTYMADIECYDPLLGTVWPVAIAGAKPLPPEVTGVENVDYGNTGAGTGSYNTVIGSGASAQGTSGTVAVGRNAMDQGGYGTSLGNGTAVVGQFGIAIGSSANVQSPNAIAIGAGTQAWAAGAVAIGRDAAGNAARSDVQDQIMLGTTNHTLVVSGKNFRVTAAGQATAAADPATGKGTVVGNVHNGSYYGMQGRAVGTGAGSGPALMLGSGTSNDNAYLIGGPNAGNIYLRPAMGNGTTDWILSGNYMQAKTPLLLPGDPTNALYAAPKQYVDARWTRWSGTQAEYDAIVTKDPNTLYVVV